MIYIESSSVKVQLYRLGALYRMTEAVDRALTFQNWRVDTQGRHHLRRAVSD